MPALPAPPPRLEGLQDVTGTGEVLPAREHLPAHQGAVLQSPIDLVQARLVRLGHGAGQARPQGDLILDLGGQGRHPGAEGVEDPGHGPGQHGDAAIGLFRGLRQPRPHRRTDLWRQLGVDEDGLWNDEALIAAQPVRFQHGVEVLGHLGASGWKNTRQYDPQGCSPIPGVLE